MSQQHIKQKLKALNTFPCQQIICDVIKLSDEMCDIAPSTEEEYGIGAMDVIKELRKRYKQTLQVADVG